MVAATIYRKNYKPYAYSVTSIDLDFELHDEYAIVSNRMRLKRVLSGALFLYGDELELLSIEINNAALDPENYRLEDGNLVIDGCADEFELIIKTRIRPQDNTSLTGLYRTSQMFCTQCEAEGFRRITFYPDRPDVLSIFSTRISADKEKYPSLLSNGNLVSSGDEKDGRHWAVWQDPFKKPSYLFALVAGRLAVVEDVFVTSSGRQVDLRIYVEPGNEDQCAHAMTSLKKAMRWDEQEFGREYDLNVFMIVAVSDFNMGAMENKGLNIFNDKYILARPDTATDQDYADIEGVVAHEYFHNWTGNRVTCRDWFQLSLKEGLTVYRDQEFSCDMNSREVNRILDVKALRNIQFPEDAGAMAHPVRPESYQEINNFYTATIYNKGAEVIRMQQTLLGKAGFRKGMDLYFERHDGQAVTIDDFVASMEDANQIDLTQFKRWYSQAGTPVVMVSSEFKGGVLTLTMTQSGSLNPLINESKDFHIPVRFALYDAVGTRLALEDDVLQLREETQTFSFDGLHAKPIVSLMRDFSAPIQLHYQQSVEELSALLRFENNGFAKWNAAQSLALETICQNYNNSDERLSPVSRALIQAFEYVLADHKVDGALRAETITPPGFEDVIAHLSLVDVARLEEVRDAFRKQLASGLFNQAMTQYHALWSQEKHAMDSASFSQRKLRNSCLWLMMKADEPQVLQTCLNQFREAKTMTDQIASLSLLVNGVDESTHQTVLADFYQQWSQNSLVLDKWFSLQATCEQPGALMRVKKLLAHPTFNFKNPNKVRALIGAFCFANPRHFHAIDGSGYGFLSEMLIKLDKINPQVAARMATPFTRWKSVDKQRQELIIDELQKLCAKNLSRDLRELVSKSLVV